MAASANGSSGIAGSCRNGFDANPIGRSLFIHEAFSYPSKLQKSRLVALDTNRATRAMACQRHPGY